MSESPPRGEPREGNAYLAARRAYVVARRIAVASIGATLLALGVVLLFAPGPGLLLMAMGLGLLSVEFAWARRWLRSLREAADDARGAVAGAPGEDR